MPLNDFKGPRLSRRGAIKAGFGVAVASQLAMIEQALGVPQQLIDQLVEQYGELALSNFAQRVAELDPARRKALERLARENN